jgi:DNA invertase Pin-like site-specific DNA recombinase
MKKRVLGLIRVSTDAQDVARQRSDIEKLKKRCDLDIIRTLELVGVSGTTTLTNEQVQEVLREMQQPNIDGLAASSVDRLFRPKRGSDFAILNAFQDSRKTLWTIRDGVLEVWTDEGWERAMNAGTRAGSEWREIRRRFLDGKAEKRLLGRCVDGSASLPCGIHYQRITDNAGRTIDGKWSYDEPELARVAKVYELLFEQRHSLAEIARLTGFCSSGAVRKVVQNPTWRGVRYHPPTADNPEGLEVKLPLKPLLTDDQWAKAQLLLAQTSAKWTRARPPREPRFLGQSLLVCSCGKKYYLCAEFRRGQHDMYFCASRRRCSARRLRRDAVDAALVELIETYVSNAKLLKAVFERIEPTPKTDTRQEREQELAKHEARRQKWIEQYDEDRITKQEFQQKMDKENAAIHAIRASMPAAPPPALDYRAVIPALVQVLARFRFASFADQRALLRRVVRSVRVVDNAIADVTLSGAFLGEMAHSDKNDPRC